MGFWARLFGKEEPAGTTVVLSSDAVDRLAEALSQKKEAPKPAPRPAQGPVKTGWQGWSPTINPTSNQRVERLYARVHRLELAVASGKLTGKRLQSFAKELRVKKAILAAMEED